MKNIRLATEADTINKLNLLNMVFGPGRYARSVYRLREKQPYEKSYSYVSLNCDELAACIDYCPTKLNGQYNGLLLGPLAVNPKLIGLGYGVNLVEYSLKKIELNSNYSFIIVVGDIDYYKKFGFNKIGKKFEFYGPVDINRVLMKKLKAELNSIKKYKFL